MYQMVVLVLDELEVSSEVLEAWQHVGVSGVTILESTGLGRVRAKMGIRDDLPFLPSLERLLQTREEEHRTMFTLVDSPEMVDELIEATLRITGDLEGPNKGILFVVPITRAIGIVSREAAED